MRRLFKNKLAKRVAIISSTFTDERPGGVPTYVQGRTFYLSKKCKVLVMALGKKEKTHIGENIYKVGLGSSKKMRTKFFIYWLKIFVEIIKFRPDHIEIHNIPVGFPLFFLFKNTCFFHGPAIYEYKAEKKGKLYILIVSLLEHLTLFMSNKVNIDSVAFKDLIYKKYSYLTNKGLLIKSPKLLIPNNKNLEIDNLKRIFEENHTNGKKILNLICVRRLVARTGVKELVQSYSFCLKNKLMKYPSKLIIIGEGPQLKNIQEIISKENIADFIDIKGKISSKERDEYYAKADWNIVPTQALEGFGLVVIEAALFGCPSLVTNVDALPHVLKMLNNQGLLCNRDNSGIIQGLSNLEPYTFNQRSSLSKLTQKKFSIKR